MQPMTELERFHACMEYQPVDRTPFWDWGGWPETLQRWKSEGLTGMENYPGRIADRRNGVWDWFFPNPPFEHKVISEDERTIVYINHEGILMKERKDNPFSSMPQFLKFPVETQEEFRTFWRERMQTDLNKRIGPDWRDRLLKLRADPVPFIVVSDRWGGFFGPLRNLTGVERLCTLFYDDPAFVEEMMDADAEMIIAIAGQILDVVQIDAFVMWEDMGYNHGPLLSPRQARKFMLPRYRRVVDFLRGRGVKYIGLDSDGQIDLLIPIWLDAGLNFLYPFEYQSGMDVNAVRRKYGRELRIWGGIDKRALARGPEAIDTELARVTDLIHAGGYLPHTDHSCPPDISLQNFAYYMERLAQVCQHA